MIVWFAVNTASPMKEERVFNSHSIQVVYAGNHCENEVF